jgi:hypothetical protein
VKHDDDNDVDCGDNYDVENEFNGIDYAYMI